MAPPAAATYPYISAADPLPWMDEAICTQTDPDAFFPDWRDAMAVWSARVVCQSCPVRAECLEFGMGETHGVWGGLSADERARMRRSIEGEAS